MKKVLWILTPLLVVVFLVPLGTATVLAAVITPAAAEQARLDACAATGQGSRSGSAPGARSWRPPFQQAYVRTSPYGSRAHPIDRRWRLHTGVDLVSQPGPGPVDAVSNGTVTAAGYRGSYGNAVDIDHGGGITSRYAHLARIDPAIRPGATITAGQVVGVEGSTGASTGNHLHLEILIDGDSVDPVPFMADRAAPLDGRPNNPTPTPAPAPTRDTPAGVEGGIGFDLPKAGQPRLASLTTPPSAIPAPVKALYVAAANKYQLPWTLLAGIGMEETAHGHASATSTAGAQGLMQFIPATFTAYGVDGDGDGRASIHSDADSIFSAANYLTKSGVTKGPDGVRAALYAYNHAQWYINDVLHYAHSYGGGLVLGDPTSCTGGPGKQGNPNLAPVSSGQVAALLAWAGQQTGDPYVFGANGPNEWDCSSFTQAAYRHIGLSMPRTAGAQRDWLAAGNGTHIPPGRERPGDLIFWDSYLGPNAIGHVVIVADPTTKTTLEARNPLAGVGTFSYADAGQGKHIYEIWRPGATAGIP